MQPQLASLLAQSRDLFKESTGHSARFFEPIVIKEGHRTRVVRCRLESSTLGMNSIMIKKIKSEAARGFSDWASLAFLSSLPEAEAIAPRFHGGDVADRIYLMEDLGTGSTLHSFLSSGDPLAARVALQNLAVQMARLHTTTKGRLDQFEALRGSLPENSGLHRFQEARAWLDARQKRVDWFEALHCEMPTGFEEALPLIADAYCHPGDFLTFTQGDPAPSNNHFQGDKVRLLDFEYGGFRHALYDITAWQMLCPLPADCVEKMRCTFQQEIANAFPAARDNERFNQEWTYLCAYRALAILTWIPPDIVLQNRPWAENWTMREAVLVTLSRLKLMTDPFPQLAAITQAAETLTRAMARSWPEFIHAEECLPTWPALFHPAYPLPAASPSSTCFPGVSFQNEL